MSAEFSPITLGERLRTVNAGGFILTETTRRSRIRIDYATRFGRSGERRANSGAGLIMYAPEIEDGRGR